MASNNQHKRVAAHHDWWARTYDKDYFTHFGIYHRVTMDNIKRFVPENLDSLILDAGGGTGIWSIELARMGYKVIMTDIEAKNGVIHVIDNVLVPANGKNEAKSSGCGA